MTEDKADERWTARLAPPKGEQKTADSRDAYSCLKNLVTHQAFRPGQQLIARDLADRLRVSATPVREALIRLAVEGLIVSVAHKGFYTKPLDVAELANKYEIAFMVGRYAIEKDVASFTMRGIRKPVELEVDKEGLIVNVTHQLSYSHAVFIEQLLERIAGLAANAEAVALVQTFNDHTHYVRVLDLEEPATVQIIADDIMGLIGHLQSRDVLAAVSRLQAIFFSKIKRLPALVKEANARALTANI